MEFYGSVESNECTKIKNLIPGSSIWEALITLFILSPLFHEETSRTTVKIDPGRAVGECDFGEEGARTGIHSLGLGPEGRTLKGRTQKSDVQKVEASYR